MTDPIETPLPRAARRLLMETLHRGEQAIAAIQREAQAAFQAAAQDVLADLDIPAGAASELVRDGQGRPVAIRWTRPEPVEKKADPHPCAECGKVITEFSSWCSQACADAFRAAGKRLDLEPAKPLTTGAKDGEPALAPPEAAK